jgi:hypothetical protein
LLQTHLLQTKMSWATDSTARGQAEGGPYPVVFADFPSSARLSWISAEDPTVDEPINSRHALRGEFTLTDPVDAVIYAAADNYLSLWLDGELVYQQDEKGDKAGWTETQQPYRVSLDAGAHVLGIIAANKLDPTAPNNPVAAVAAVYTADITGAPIQLIYQTGATLADSQGAQASAAVQWRAIALDEITGITAGWVMGQLLDEAQLPQADGGLEVATAGIIHRTFTDTTDTAGDPWPEIGGEVGAIAMPVGTEGTDVTRRLAAYGFTAAMRPATGGETAGGNVYTLDAWLDPGTDHTATVTLNRDNLTRLEADVTGIVATALLVRHDEGWVLVTEPTAEATYGTRAATLELGLVLDATNATTVAEAELTQLSRLTDAATAVLIAGAPDGTGPTPHADFTVADTITGPDRTGTPTDWEVVALGGEWTGDGDTTVIQWTLTLKEPT